MGRLALLLTTLLVLIPITQIVSVEGETTVFTESDYNANFESDLHLVMAESTNGNITDIEIITQLYLLEQELTQVENIDSIYSFSSFYESLNQSWNAKYSLYGNGTFTDWNLTTLQATASASANLSESYGRPDDQSRIDQVVGELHYQERNSIFAEEDGSWKYTLIQIRTLHSNQSLSEIQDIISSFPATDGLEVSFVEDASDLHEKFGFDRISCVISTKNMFEYTRGRMAENSVVTATPGFFLSGLHLNWFAVQSDAAWQAAMELWGENQSRMFVGGDDYEYVLIYIYHDDESDEFIQQFTESYGLSPPILLYSPTPTEKSFIDFFTPTLISGVIGMGVLIGIIAFVWIRQKT